MAMNAPTSLTLGRRPLPQLVADLRQADVSLNAYAEALLASGDVGICATVQPVRIAVHTVAELGWAEGATVDDVLQHIGDRGLAPCPLEVALLLRLAWRDISVSPRVTVASARTRADETHPRGFYLRDDDACWLRAYVASDDWVMAPDERVALLTR